MAENIFETKASRADKKFTEMAHPLIDNITKDWSQEDFSNLIIETLSTIDSSGLLYLLRYFMTEAIIRNEPHIITEAVVQAAHSHDLVNKERESRITKAAFKKDLDQIQDL